MEGKEKGEKERKNERGTSVRYEVIIEEGGRRGG